MKLYRYSPIRNRAQLTKALKHIHFACHMLCKQAMGKYLPVSGNIGVFCHYEDEFVYLTKVREELTDESDDFNGKYFRLYEPIVIPKKGDVPKTTYTYLYVRQPDPHRYQVGDVDFYMEPKKYRQLKKTVKKGNIKGARVFPRPDLDMVQLYDPDIDCCSFVVTWRMRK